MPRFKIKLSDGRTVEIESDTEPTEDEVLSAVGEFESQPEDVGSQMMYAPPMPWVRNPSVEQPPPDDRTLGERATASLAQGGIGLQQGFHGLGEQGWSLVQAAYEPIVEVGPIAITAKGPMLASSARENAAFARESALEARKRSQALEPLAQEIGGAPIMRTIGQAIPSVAPALALGPLGVPAAIGASGAQAGGATLSEAQAVFEQAPEERRKGAFPNVEFWDAAGPAALDAIQTAAITAVSGRIFGQGIEGATVPMRREAIKQTVGSRAKEVLGEAIEEGAQQFLSDYVVAQMSYNPEMTFGQAVKGAIDAAVAGGIVGGGLVTARAITEPRQAEAPPIIPPEQRAGTIDEAAINRGLEQQRAQPERTTDALDTQAKEVFPSVQQPEVAQEGQVALPADEGKPPTGETLTETEAPAAEPATTTPTEPVGMGGATPAEFKPPVPFTTSNKNAVVDEERKARGLPPMMSVARQSNQSAWDDAMRQIDENPKIQDDLIADLAVNPRALTTTENAILLHRRIDLRNEYEKALHRWRTAFESDNLLQAAEESRHIRDWSAKLSDLEDITKRTGAESGRSLQARKMMANEDFSLAAMELRAMEAKGRALTPAEHVELIKAQARILELENQLLALEANRDSIEIAKGTAETMGDVSKEAPKEPTSKDFDVDREETLLSGIKAKVDKGQVNEITPLVQKLARLFWRRGIRQREPMIDALHQTLQTIIPGFTRDQTQRAFSGYGNFKPLSKEDIDVGLRDLRGQTQQVLKLEALEARNPLEKTGQERRVPSDEERRLIKQVNELKRKYGVVVTDPEMQLKSALAARKTYYEHRIADLKHEIETRQRIVKDKTAPPTDPELDALIAEHERLKAEHEQIFVRPEMSDEQRLKMAIAAAERNQAHWEVRLENAEKGIFDKRTPGRKVTSPELELIQAETAAIREHVKELHDLDAAVLEAKRAESLERQKANLEKDIAEQERKLREGDLTGPGKRMARPADPALEELLQKRDALNEQLKEARKKPEAQKYAEAQQRELERLNKAIAEREAKIAAGDISTEPKKVSRPLPPELEQARQKLEAVNKQLAEMRKAARPVKTKEEIALQSLKTRMKNRAAEFRRRILAKDFAKRVRKPVKLDEEGRRLKAEVDLAKEQFETALEQDRWAKMSIFQKTKRKIADIYDAARAIMTTGEFSFILRQGKLATLSRPLQTAKALPDMFRALLSSEQRAREIDMQTHNDPDADAARAAKLYLVEEGVSLHKQEEILMGRWVGKIPIVKNFNRAAQVFLNRIRLDMWKAMRKSLTRSGTPTPEEDRQIAMFVNEATGRGGLGKLEPAAVPLARVMFSPRYYASRLQLAAGHSLWGGTMRTRRIIATEYARALVGLGLYYTALAMMFSSDDDEEKGKIESDPRSSDFGKVQVGNTRLDPLAGLSQVIVLGARTATGEKKTMAGEVQPLRGENVPFGGDKWSDIVARHLRGKLHPVPGAVANLFDGTDLGGDEATVINQTKNMVAPITYIDIWTALKEEGLDDGAALALLALLGEGLQTYEER